MEQSHNHGKPMGDEAAFRERGLAFVREREDEGPEEAIKRYEAFLAFVQGEKGLGDDHEFLRHNRVAFHQGPVAMRDLAQVERRYKLTLPPSYVAFVTIKGLFSFGDGAEARMLVPQEIISLWDWHLAQGFDERSLPAEFDLNKSAIRLWKRSIAFAHGDEGLELVLFHCFRFDSQDPVTKEVCIWDFNQNDPFVFSEATGEICSGRSMDVHLNRVINERIRDTLERV